jgi:hypothetical protein
MATRIQVHKFSKFRQQLWSLSGGKQDYVALVVASGVGDGFAITGVMKGPDLAGSEVSELALRGVAQNGEGPDVWCAGTNVRQSHRAVIGRPRDGVRGVIESFRNGWLGLERAIIRGDHGEQDLAVFAGSSESDMAAVHGGKSGTERGAVGDPDGWTASKRQFEDKARAVELFQVENPVPGAAAYHTSPSACDDRRTVIFGSNSAQGDRVWKIDLQTGVSSALTNGPSENFPIAIVESKLAGVGAVKIGDE